MCYAIYCENREGSLEDYRNVRPVRFQHFKSFQEKNRLLIADTLFTQ